MEGFLRYQFGGLIFIYFYFYGNFNFLGTKTLYQNNFSHIASFFTLFEGYKIYTFNVTSYMR